MKNALFSTCNSWLIYLFMLTISIGTFSCKTSKHRKHTYMERAYQELKDSFPDAQVVMMHDSIRLIFPDNIMFNTDESTILPSFDPKLIRFSQVFNKFDKTNLLITGYTDNTGDTDHNQKLSENRSLSVKQRVIQLQVKPDRIFTWGLGAKSPIADNKTEEGRAKNRRVELVILFT